MMSVQTRRYVALSVAAVVLIGAVAYTSFNKKSVILPNESSSNDGLVLQEEFEMDEATRILFAQRMAVAEAAIDARNEVDDVDQFLILALASDADFIGDLAKARQVYEDLLQINPIDYVVWSNYASVLARMGAIDQADEAYWQALNLNAAETQFEKYVRFLKTYQPEGYRERVLEMYELDVQVHGQTKWNMNGLADWYLVEGDCVTAVSYLENVKRIDPEDEYVDVDIERARNKCE